MHTCINIHLTKDCLYWNWKENGASQYSIQKNPVCLHYINSCDIVFFFLIKSILRSLLNVINFLESFMKTFYIILTIYCIGHNNEMRILLCLTTKCKNEVIRTIELLIIDRLKLEISLRAFILFKLNFNLAKKKVSSEKLEHKGCLVF